MTTADTDQDDVRQFEAWVTGPTVLYQDPEAGSADFDDDGDVDQVDFGMLQISLE